MNAHRFSSLLVDVDQEPPATPASMANPGFAVVPVSQIPCLTKEQIESAQQLHKLAFEQAMQSLAPPPASRRLFDSMN